MQDITSAQYVCTPLLLACSRVQELFTSTVGPVTRIGIAYDRNGKSTGQATIELRRPGDAQVAFKQYNGRLIDGST